jgi:hypothetical protein
MERKEMIEILVKYILENEHRQNAYTLYERSLLELKELENEVMEVIHKIWKERVKNGE